MAKETEPVALVEHEIKEKSINVIKGQEAYHTKTDDTEDYKMKML